MSVFSLIPGAAGSGGGEVDLSAVTAGSEQILAGYRSVDSNGDPVYGGIYPVNTDTVFAGEITDLPGPEMIEFAIPETGYYMGYGFGLWASYSDLARAIGLTAAKIKTGYTILGIAGQG